MEKAVVEAIIREKCVALGPVMDERTRRLWAATAAKALGHRGQTLVARATGMSRSTLHLGLRERERPLPSWHPASGCVAVVQAARR
jgi:DNA-binding phage protein